jgi:hypothetical protein
MSTVEQKKDDLERSKKRPYLGNTTGTEASHERRGLQPFQPSEKNSAANLELVEEIDQETGEIITYLVTEKGKRVYRTFQESRGYRYFLKAVINKIMTDSRILICSRTRLAGKDVQILKSLEHGKAHYSGLMRCGSPWGCPICAAQISERRKVEVKAAIATARMMGWSVHLMTCTVPHGLGDDVNVIRKQLAKAWRRMTTGRAGKEVRKKLSIEGTIRAIEVTYGLNGFHPHYHILIFSSRKFGSEVFKYFFLPLWQDACVKSGLGRPSDEHGLDVRDGLKADEYVSKGAFGLEKDKWGLESELTKGHTKITKSKTGSTPFGLLEDYAINGTEKAKNLFLVYFKAFKGSRQLYWSNGLKSKLSVEDYTDEELIAKADDECNVLATLTVDQWRAVLSVGAEAALLDIAEKNPLDIPAFLDSLIQVHKQIVTHQVSKNEKK